jgi:spore maturation protein CgeB
MKKMLFVSSSSKEKLNSMYEAFKDIDELIVDISYKDNIDSSYYNDKRSFIDKVFSKLKLPFDKYNHNKRIINKCKEVVFDYIFIVKGNHIKPSTLKKIKIISRNTKLISWTQDDMFAWHNRSLYYTLGLKYYDLIVTQKSYNCNKDELPSLGAKNILFQNKSFLPRLHKPCKDCSKIKFKHDVLFIGFAEKERYESINFLAKNGIRVVIYGSGWDKVNFKGNEQKNLTFHYENLVNENYANAISCSKISLCFLRKQNRDLQTSRTVEIPACGGFMLAEKTREQMDLFEDGKEAVYFSNDDELLKNVKYYLDNEKERRLIRSKGLKKCLDSDYSYQNRAKEIIQKAGSL